MAIVSFWMTLIWWYASHNNRLTDEHLDPQIRRRELLGPIATALVFLLSIGIAFIEPDLAKLAWLFILPASLYAHRRQVLE